MSNVVSLQIPRRATQAERQAALVGCFAQERRTGEDVFWLKENAELLGILECTGAELPHGALDYFEVFYAQIEKRMRFFPQYYRFLLSLCLDLEDLGLSGTKGEALCAWVGQVGLAEAELSDLQRAEARRLLDRRGGAIIPHESALTDRLHKFINRSATFVVPNKKAAYELTHIVFYLSEYGRRDPGLSTQAVTSLEFAGLLAYLDQNIDLLAEVCVALRFAGQTPSKIWESAVLDAQNSHSAIAAPGGDLHDDYHEYFVASWAAQVMGAEGFSSAMPEGRVTFHKAGSTLGALRPMSECMFHLDDARNGDWTRMRPHVEAYLSEDGQCILSGAEQSTNKFDVFFEGFARVGAV